MPVHIPQLATREHRWLVKYRKTIVGRINRVQNILRALYQQHGLSLPVGARCWTITNLDAMQQQSRPLADCAVEELWRGELAHELATYHSLQAELKQLETKLTDLAARDEWIKATGDLGAVPEKELIRRGIVRDVLSTEYEARRKLHPDTPPVP